MGQFTFSRHLILWVGMFLASLPGFAQAITIDHTCTDITKIPDSWINQVKSVLKVHYAHTSHGEQPLEGCARLMAADSKYNYYPDNCQVPDTTEYLSLMDGQYFDNSCETYIGPELYWQGNAAMNITRAVLDSFDVNVSTWTWCTQLNSYSAAQVQEYLNNMAQLESEYPNVTFVYMTGNAQSQEQNRVDRNNQIREFCRQNNKVLFDFADLDCWYNGQQYTENGIPMEHPHYHGDEAGHTTYESCENKARAFWWMMARLAGWNGLENRGVKVVSGDFNGNGQDDLAGLNPSNAVFYSTDLSTWTQVPGALKSLMVGAFNNDGMDDLAGLNDTGSIFYTTNLNTWTQIPGALESLMAGDFNGDGNSDLAGLNAVGGVYYTTDLSTWTQVPGTMAKLVTGDFNNDGKDDLAGLNSAGLIYYTTDLNTWTQVPGSLDDLVAGDFNNDGLEDMAGLNAQGNVYYTVNLISWTQVPGTMAQLLSADLNGNGASDLAGLNALGHIYYTTDLNTWTQIPGQLAKLVSGNLNGTNGEDLAGLNTNGEVFYTTDLNTWTQIPGQLAPY